MPSLPQVHALGANKTGLPGLILSYPSCVGLWIPQHISTWGDFSPYANNGSATDVTYTGTAPFARMPIVPGVFNGTSSRVDVTDHASIKFTTAMTAVIWYSGNPANNSTMIGQYNTGANVRRWRIARSNATGNRMQVVVSSDGQTTNAKIYDASSFNAFDSAWHQLAFTWSSGTLTLYGDGAAISVTKITDASFTDAYTAGTAPTQIGCSDNNGTAGLFAAGSYGIAAVFNAALTAADIQAMYLVGVNGP